LIENRDFSNLNEINVGNSFNIDINKNENVNNLINLYDTKNLEGLMNINDFIENLRNFDSPIDSINDDNKLICILLGITGSGKTSLCNSLLGKSYSKKCNFLSDTLNCKEYEFNNYILVDTPGLCDTNLRDNEFIDEILGKLVHFCRGINKIYFCVDGNNTRIDPSTRKFLDLLNFIFPRIDDPDFFEIIFTRVDKLELNEYKDLECYFDKLKELFLEYNYTIKNYTTFSIYIEEERNKFLGNLTKIDKDKYYQTNFMKNFMNLKKIKNNLENECHKSNSKISKFEIENEKYKTEVQTLSDRIFKLSCENNILKKEIVHLKLENQGRELLSKESGTLRLKLVNNNIKK